MGLGPDGNAKMGPKKGSNIGAKMEPFGSQIRTILTLEHHLGEIGAQKATSKKEFRIWGGGALREV